MRIAGHVAQITTHSVFASISVSIIASQAESLLIFLQEDTEDRDRAGFDSLAEKQLAIASSFLLFWGLGDAV